MIKTFTFLIGIANQPVFAGCLPLAVNGKLLPTEIFHELSSLNPDQKNVVLIHGLGGTSSTWYKARRDLSPKFNVLTYDVRGHGLTPPRGTKYDSGTLATDLVDLLNHNGLGKVHVLGWSLGGKVAARFAEKFPDRVESLIFEDADLLNEQITKNDTDLALEDYENAVMRDSLTLSSSAEIRDFSLKRFGSSSIPGWYMNLAGIEQSEDKVVLNSQVGAGMFLWSVDGRRENLSSVIRNIKVPILVMAPDFSQPNISLSEKKIQQLKDLNRNIEVVRFPKAAHAIHVSNLGQFQMLTSAFLAGKDISVIAQDIEHGR